MSTCNVMTDLHLPEFLAFNERCENAFKWEAEAERRSEFPHGFLDLRRQRGVIVAA